MASIGRGLEGILDELPASCPVRYPLGLFQLCLLAKHDKKGRCSVIAVRERGDQAPVDFHIGILGGRGSLSFMRFEQHERPPAPLYGLSSPGLLATPDDPFGSFVVTVIHHGPSCTVSVGGTGIAGDAAGARAVLDVLVEELRQVSG